MSSIITTHYRYKRPPRKRKAVALNVPALVTKTKHVAEPNGSSKAALSIATTRSPAPANAAPGSAIVTARRSGRFGDAPDLTPEEHKRRGDAADALWRELVRRVRQDRYSSRAVASGLDSNLLFPLRSLHASPFPSAVVRHSH